MIDVDVRIVGAPVPLRPKSRRQAADSENFSGQAMPVVPRPRAAAHYLVITVSNSREDSNRVTDGEALFVPFKAKRQSASAANGNGSSTKRKHSQLGVVGEPFEVAA